jgi:uncharacterized membrane protein YcjF (UPF0283 family)
LHLQPPEPKEFELRPGDSGEDRPTQIPQQLTPLSDADLKAIETVEETALLREMREAEELLASEPGLFGLPSFLSHPLIGTGMLAFATILGLFVFNQVTSILNGLATLPTYWQYAGWVGLGVLGLGLLYSVLRLSWFYVRLRRNKQLRIKGLEELEKRTRMRWLVNAKIKEAKDQLIQYLREYPLADGKERKRLIALGVNQDTLLMLAKVKENLLDPNRWPSDDVWFATFRDQFQSRLDEAAKIRINYWARRTAVATAVSPNTLTDTMMTLYFSFTMLGDLCNIYNLRAGRFGTMVLLARVFFNSYLAGQINEMEHLTAEQIQHLVSPHLPVSELVVAKVLGKVGAKAGAGVINYYLLTRLGKFGTRLLRPVGV